MVTLRSKPRKSATLRGPFRKRAHEHRDKRRRDEPAGVAEATTVARALRLHSPSGPDLAIHRSWGGCRLGLPGLDVLPVHWPAGASVSAAAMPSDAARDLARRRFLFGTSDAQPTSPPPRPVAVLASSCLAVRGILCMSCRDACPTGAIRFALAPGGARPRIEAAACTGYDECALVCPVNAIALDATCQAEAPDA
jgi:ferredoxin-type protein NapF